MPYWNREPQLKNTLGGFDRFYRDIDMEVIVSVDGCAAPDLPEYSFPVKIVSLPEKDEPKNPCVPINRGVMQAEGSVLVITNPENYHKEPIFPRMMEALLSLGPRGYVLASCWGEAGRWQCHPEHRNPGQDVVPDGFGLHFCAMMYGKFYPGFDEDYRDGMGYDDNDFAFRIHAAGGIPRILGDCVVYHPKSTLRWDGKMNRSLFRRKWNLS